MAHFYSTPGFFRLLSKHLHWKIPTTEKEIYLTFDDGPIPELTDYVLQQLEEFQAGATFFCVGDNIRKYPDIFRKIVGQGHAVGNHTYNHLKAWSSYWSAYVQNVRQCQALIEDQGGGEAQPLMRPPHGQITKKLISVLKHEYKIIMWDVLTYDFSMQHAEDKSLTKAIQKTSPGSIVVFHDNYKAESKLRYMLPRYLAHFRDLGYNFKKLSAV